MFENLEDDIEELLADFEQGLLLVGDSEIEKCLLRDFELVRRNEDGTVDFSSITDLVKGTAHTRGSRTRGRIRPISPKGTTNLRDFNIELFARLNDAFTTLTDKPATAYGSLTEFFREFEKPRYHESRLQTFCDKINELPNFYTEKSLDSELEIPLHSGNFTLAGPRFYRETLDSVVSMALYTDTIIIPDPILPWLERERPEEAEVVPELMECLFHVLQLSPLVDADIPGLPVALLPTWSKTRELHDTLGQWEKNRALTQFFRYYLDVDLSDIHEVLEFARSESKRFREQVSKNNLFQPHGGTGDVVQLPLEELVRRQREYYQQVRAPEYAKLLAGATDEEIIWLGIRERMDPVQNLVLQCRDHGSQPIHWLPVQWFSFEQYAEAMGARQYEPSTLATLEALEDPSLKWLSNVPIRDLAQLRREGANLQFRQRLNKCVSELDDFRQSEPRAYVDQISRELEAMVTSHQNEIKNIVETYQKKHKHTAVVGWLGVAALMFPATAPIVGKAMAPALVGLKYANDKLNELADQRRAQSSLLGVLASAARKD